MVTFIYSGVSLSKVAECRDMEVEMRFDCFKSTCKALQQSLGLVPIEHCLHCPYCTNRLCKMAAPLGQTGAIRTSQKKLGRMLGLLSLMMVCRSVVSSSCHIYTPILSFALSGGEIAASDWGIFLQHYFSSFFFSM